MVPAARAGPMGTQDPCPCCQGLGVGLGLSQSPLGSAAPPAPQGTGPYWELKTEEASPLEPPLFCLFPEVLKGQQRGWRALGPKMCLLEQGEQDLLLSPRALPGPAQGAMGRPALLPFPPAGWRGQTAPVPLTTAPLELQSPSTMVQDMLL